MSFQSTGLEGTVIRRRATTGGTFGIRQFPPVLNYPKHVRILSDYHMRDLMPFQSTELEERIGGQQTVARETAQQEIDKPAGRFGFKCTPCRRAHKRCLHNGVPPDPRRLVQGPCDNCAKSTKKKRIECAGPVWFDEDEEFNNRGPQRPPRLGNSSAQPFNLPPEIAMRLALLNLSSNADGIEGRTYDGNSRQFAGMPNYGQGHNLQLQSGLNLNNLGVDYMELSRPDGHAEDMNFDGVYGPGPQQTLASTMCVSVDHGHLDPLQADVEVATLALQEETRSPSSENRLPVVPDETQALYDGLLGEVPEDHLWITRSAFAFLLVGHKLITKLELLEMLALKSNPTAPPLADEAGVEERYNKLMLATAGLIYFDQSDRANFLYDSIYDYLFGGGSRFSISAAEAHEWVALAQVEYLSRGSLQQDLHSESPARREIARYYVQSFAVHYKQAISQRTLILPGFLRFFMEETPDAFMKWCIAYDEAANEIVNADSTAVELIGEWKPQLGSFLSYSGFEGLRTLLQELGQIPSPHTQDEQIQGAMEQQFTMGGAGLSAVASS